MPESTTSGIYYPQAQAIYRQAGWSAPLPLPHRMKEPPPAGYVGRGKPLPGDEEFGFFARQNARGNTCLRANPDVIGLDVDHYSEHAQDKKGPAKTVPGERKTGGESLRRMQELYGPLPATWRSSARPAPSGIYWYRHPQLPDIVNKRGNFSKRINKTETGFPDIDVIHHEIRYAVVWPSIHPSGAPYLWWLPSGEPAPAGAVPAPGDLPLLPDAWLDAINRDVPLRQEPDLFSEVWAPTPEGALNPPSWPAAPPTLGAQQKVPDRLAQALADLTGANRHDTIRDHIMALARYEHRGDAEATAALAALREPFTATVGPDRPGGHTEAEHEYDRLVGGARAEAARTPDTRSSAWPAWAAGPAANGHNPTGPKQASGQNLTTHPGGRDPKPRTLKDIAQAAPTPPDEPLNIDAVWEQLIELRPDLQPIADKADAVDVNRWGLLAAVLTLVIADTPATVQLPRISGRAPGTPNLYTVFVGSAAAGKGTTTAAAAELVPGDPQNPRYTRNIGSGEGLSRAFLQGDTPRPQVHIDIAEIDTLTAIRGRGGETLTPFLRQGWSGEAIGVTYAKRDDTIKPPYRLTAVIGAQPGRCAPLLAPDAVDGGLTARLLAVPVLPTTPAPPLRGAVVDPLKTFGPPLDADAPPSGMRAEDGIPEYIHQLIAQQKRGHVPALRRHRPYLQLKVAAGFALLAGRWTITWEQDWDAADMLLDVSDATWDAVARHVEETEIVEARRRGKLAGHTLDASNETRVNLEMERSDQRRNWVLKKLKESRLTAGGLRRAAAGKHRHLLPSVLAALLADGLIDYRAEDGTYGLRAG